MCSATATHPNVDYNDSWGFGMHSPFILPLRFRAMAATGDPRVQRLAEEWNRLKAGFAIPDNDKIAETLVLLHQDQQGLHRYVYASCLCDFFVEKDPDIDTAARRLQIACTTEVPLTVLNILLDPRIYVWEIPSDFFHAALEVSTSARYAD